MNKLLVALLVLLTIAVASAAEYNYDSAYIGSYSSRPHMGAFTPPNYYNVGYAPYYSLHPRTCIGGGCKAAAQYSPRMGYSYDIYGNSYGGSYYTGGASPTYNYVTPYDLGGSDQYKYSGTFGSYGKAPVAAARICGAGGSCHDVGTTNWYG